MGPLNPINDFAGVLIQQYSNDLEETLEMAVQKELAEAKEEGLKGVQSFVDRWGHNKDYAYRLEAISSETASKLLQGEFKTFEELTDYERNSRSMSISKISILYRIIENKLRGDLYIIETLFINE